MQVPLQMKITSYYFSVYSACTSDNKCDKNALCLNAFDTYKCQCRPGFIDMSPDPENKPGRLCKERRFFEFSNFLSTVSTQLSICKLLNYLKNYFIF